MHGTNQLRPRESKPGLLQVQDIWPTIQGEGPFSGMPAIFVRLTGCHLACTFCDTKWDDAKDPYLQVHSGDSPPLSEPRIGILERIHKINYAEGKLFEHKLIVLTGGEPCRQDLGVLIRGLLEENRDYQIQVETAGTFWQDILAHPSVTIVCSPKTKVVHPKIMWHCTHWKYVIQASNVARVTDGLPAGSTQTVTKEMIKSFVAVDLYQNAVENNPAQLEPGGLLYMVTGSAKFGPPARPPQREGVTVWLSPCNEDDEITNRANLMAVRDSCMKHGYRAMVQLHRYLEVP